MNTSEKNRPIKLAILQRVCPSYRLALFSKLSKETSLKMLLFIGEDLPDSKVKSSPRTEGVNLHKLKTRFIKLGKRVLPWHIGLIAELRRYDPDVILCEGESHFIGYLQAIFYKLFFKRQVALMHWCFISLPGWEGVGGKSYRFWIKKFFRKFFDAFVVYSSFSRDCLVELGQPKEKVFVATNVGDVEKFMMLSGATSESKSEARKRINLPEKFTVLYIGTLDEVKRPSTMLDLAGELGSDGYNFVLLGGGPMLYELRERTLRENLTNVFLPGQISDDLPLYYRAADVLLIPGRGGIIISEAMAFGLPVIVHEADGTEYDLVQNRVTGIRQSSGSVAAFSESLIFLSKDSELCQEMGENSELLLRNNFTTDNMVRQISKAAHFARDTRTSAAKTMQLEPPKQ